MVMEVYGIKLLYPSAAIMIAAIALGISLFSSVLHRAMVDRKKLDKSRKRFEEHQKEFIKAQKENNEKKIRKLEGEQEALMKEFKDTMLKSMGPSFLIMPVALGAWWYVSNTYSSLGPIVDLPIGLPFLTNTFGVAGVINGMDWLGVYILVALGTSLVLELVLRSILKK